MSLLRPTQPVVFINRTATPWSLRPGYDISVIFPEEDFVNGRPTWANLWGARVPYTVNGNVCQRHWPCLVAARYADEGDDAIPADRMVLDPVPLNAVPSDRVRAGGAAPFSEIYLRPGKYRLVYSDEDNVTLFSQNVTVRDRRKLSGTTPPDSRPAQPLSLPARDGVVAHSIKQQGTTP